MCGALRSFSFNYFYFKKNFIDILEKKGCVVDVYINAYSFSNNSKNPKYNKKWSNDYQNYEIILKKDKNIKFYSVEEYHESLVYDFINEHKLNFMTCVEVIKKLENDFKETKDKNLKKKILEGIKYNKENKYNKDNLTFTSISISRQIYNLQKKINFNNYDVVLKTRPDILLLKEINCRKFLYRRSGYVYRTGIYNKAKKKLTNGVGGYDVLFWLKSYYFKNYDFIKNLRYLLNNDSLLPERVIELCEKDLKLKNDFSIINNKTNECFVILRPKTNMNNNNDNDNKEYKQILKDISTNLKVNNIHKTLKNNLNIYN